MPTYDYRCTACEHSFEQYQAFTDNTLTDCPSCGKPELRKVFSSIGVTFNGSGFYRTDSRGTTKADASGSGSGAGSGSGGKSSEGSASKSSEGSGSSGS